MRFSFLTLKILCVALLAVAVVAVGVSDSSAQDPKSPMSGPEPPDFNRVGQSGFQFLHLPTDAHTAGLAGIKSGRRRGTAAAAFYDPANLASVENLSLSLSSIPYVADIQYNTAALAKTFEGIGTFAGQVRFLDFGTMYRTENVFNEEIGITERSGDLGTFTASDLMVGLSYATSITDRLEVGGTLGYIREDLAETTVENMTMDFGLFYETGFRSLRFSLNAQNLGPDQEFVGFSQVFGIPQSVRMPIDFRAGVAYDFISENTFNVDQRLSAFVEGVHPNDGPERIHTALEYGVMDVITLRGGYRFNYDEQGLTLGGGIDVPIGNFEARAEYAYLDFGRLSQVHAFTLGMDLD